MRKQEKNTNQGRIPTDTDSEPDSKKSKSSQKHKAQQMEEMASKDMHAFMKVSRKLKQQKVVVPIEIPAKKIPPETSVERPILDELMVTVKTTDELTRKSIR